MQLLETTIETWPGADYTREEQLEKIQQLQQSVERKRYATLSYTLEYKHIYIYILEMANLLRASRDQLRQLVQAIQQLETK